MKKIIVGITLIVAAVSLGVFLFMIFGTSDSKKTVEELCKLGNDAYDAGDYTKAVKWYKKAAKQGDDNAQRRLGWCYAYGKGVKEDYEKAFEWYEKSAVQGNAEAQIGLGLCYNYGRGVKQDYAKAFEWYKKAAEQCCGNVIQYTVGYCYEEGLGVRQDYDKALEWYRKSAELGNENAKEAVERIINDPNYYED